MHFIHIKHLTNTHNIHDKVGIIVYIQFLCCLFHGKLCFCWSYLNSFHFTSHGVLTFLELGVHRLPPSAMLHKVFLLHELQDTLFWALCSWVMPVNDASVKAMITSICNCLFACLNPLIHSAQQGSRSHDSSLYPESLVQVWPDTGCVHNKCRLKRLMCRLKKEEEWAVFQCWYLINSCIQLVPTLL